jgi:hypothetical protein
LVGLGAAPGFRLAHSVHPCASPPIEIFIFEASMLDANQRNRRRQSWRIEKAADPG